MKLSEKEFIQKVNIFNKDIEVISRYKGMNKPILIKDKYGVCKIRASSTLKYKSSISAALNKTEYFMNMLNEAYPEIYKEIKAVSTFEGMNLKFLVENKFGIMSVYPSNLIQGHMPNIRSAINKKQYFKNMLLDIYGNRYDFKIENTDRRNGRSILICPIHGEVSIDNEYIFQGIGCPKCNNNIESNVFYLIRLFNKEESFFKLGISHIKKDRISRFKDYRNLGYDIEEMKIIEFKSSIQCRELELKLKRLIKNNLYTPKNWKDNSSTESFKDDLLGIILNNL